MAFTRPARGRAGWGRLVRMAWLAVTVPDLGGRANWLGELVDAVEVRFDWVPAGSPPLVPDFEAVVTDLAATVAKAAAEHPGLPVVPVGHGIGGTIAVRHAQRQPEQVAALVLAAPVLGPWPALDLLSEAEIPPDGPYGPLHRDTLRAIDECLTTIDFDHPLGDDLPALWVHADDDRLVPVSDTRAGMDRIRGLRFEERIYPHDFERDVVPDIAEFVHRTVPS